MLALLKGEKEVISIIFLTLMFLKAMMLKKKKNGASSCVLPPALPLTPCGWSGQSPAQDSIFRYTSGAKGHRETSDSALL